MTSINNIKFVFAEGSEKRRQNIVHCFPLTMIEKGRITSTHRLDVIVRLEVNARVC